MRDRGLVTMDLRWETTHSGSYGHVTHDVTKGCQYNEGVPRRQPHRRSGLATLPSVGAVA